MSQTLGIIDIVWRGAALDVEKGTKLKLGGYKQTKVLVDGKVHYSREYEESEVEATVPFLRGQKIDALFVAGTGELQVNCDTGQSYVFADAFLANRPEMTAGEGGKMKMMWNAGAYEELLNG